jgi:acyl-coenzyme A thioesterase PaaI-like protein
LAPAKSLPASGGTVVVAAVAAAVAGGGGGGLHAEQHYTYHRHPKAGDVLTATAKPGKTWEKEGRRSGKLVFSESVTEYRDQNGELVVTARSVGVRTERPVDQSKA